MTETARKLLDQVLELDDEERLRIADALYASVESVRETPTSEVAAAWRAEIDRRLRDVEEGRVVPIPAPEAMARHRRRLEEKKNGGRSSP